MIEQIDLAWLAGLFDGEGCIGLWKRIVNGRPDGWYYNVSISNSNPSIILRSYTLIMDISRQYEIKTRPYIRGDRHLRGNRRPCFSVDCLSKTMCEAVLKSIRPYLIGKGPQADIFLMAITAKGSDARGADNHILRAAADQLKMLKSSYGDAEVTLQGLRLAAHRNEYEVSPNNNPRMSVRHEAEAS